MRYHGRFLCTKTYIIGYSKDVVFVEGKVYQGLGKSKIGGIQHLNVKDEQGIMWAFERGTALTDYFTYLPAKCTEKTLFALALKHGIVVQLESSPHGVRKKTF